MKSPTTSSQRGEEKIDRKWLWHYRTLRGLWRRLMREHDEHRHAVAEAPLEHDVDWAETASDEAERDIIYAELCAEEGALAEVDAALDRLRRGTYGVCEESGKVIPDERLRAVPWTRFTREVAERHERQAR